MFVISSNNALISFIIEDCTVRIRWIELKALRKLTPVVREPGEFIVRARELGFPKLETVIKCVKLRE